MTRRRCGLEDATRVEQPLRVERRLDGAHEPHGVGAALRLQPLAPGRPDAVLAGDRAAQVERRLVQVGLDRLGDRLAARVAALEDEVRVEVAVAGMPERPDPDVVPRGDRSIARSMSGTRDRGTPTSSIFTSPSFSSAQCAARRAWRSRSASAASASAPWSSRRRPRRPPRRGPARRRLPRAGRSDSIISIAAASRSSPSSWTSSTARIVNRSISSSVTGDRPAAVIAATASPAASSVGKKASSVARGGGVGRSRSVASVMSPSVPCDADEQVGQRVAGDVLDVAAAGPDDAAVGHDDLERQDPVARLAVLHAAQPAGVRAQVAADRAHLVARRVRRVEQPCSRDGGLELGVDDAGLGDDAQVGARRSRGSGPSR